MFLDKIILGCCKAGQATCAPVAALVRAARRWHTVLSRYHATLRLVLLFEYGHRSNGSQLSFFLFAWNRLGVMHGRKALKGPPREIKIPFLSILLYSRIGEMSHCGQLGFKYDFQDYSVPHVSFFCHPVPCTIQKAPQSA